MNILVVFGVTLVLACFWIFAEVKAKEGLRLLGGFACIAWLLLSVLAYEHRQALVDAHYRAAIQLIGDAIEKDDWEKVKRGVSAFNEGGSTPEATSRMLDILSQKK
jgi:hypothetical protein